jgi:hypothetical protein
MPGVLWQLAQLHMSRHELGRYLVEHPGVAVAVLLGPVLVLYTFLGGKTGAKEFEWKTPKVGASLR